jgi:lipopolysaccharide biosynthesis regulator YciM
MTPKYCRQCSIRVFGEDLEYFKKKGRYSEKDQFYYTCEGCGYTKMDHLGNCLICKDCSEKGKIVIHTEKSHEFR